MIYELDETGIWFPPVEDAEEDGLLAFGGDLSVERLVEAYRLGIFPWYSDESPILWFAPHERFVLFPASLKISKSMRQILRSEVFQVTENKAFAEVINACASFPRKDQDGTWITDDMQHAYIALNQQGIAHSVEVWKDGELVGGLYGVKTGNIFCGESMFSRVSNASKRALIHLCEAHNFRLIDCQIESEHLKSMGAVLVSREEYGEYLKA